MAKTSLEETTFEIIKAHVLSPESDGSGLSLEKQEILSRWIAMSKLIDLYPNQRHCIKLHLQKFNGITERTAYNDFQNAKKLYNSMHRFDYDFWHAWIINNIVRSIKRAEDANDFKALAAMQRNFLVALGEKATDEINPEIFQQHTYITVFNLTGELVKMTLEELYNLPYDTKNKLVKMLEQPITEDQAAILMKT